MSFLVGVVKIGDEVLAFVVGVWGRGLWVGVLVWLVYLLGTLVGMMVSALWFLCQVGWFVGDSACWGCGWCFVVGVAGVCMLGL